jgi:hypothetical protein
MAWNVAMSVQFGSVAWLQLQPSTTVVALTCFTRMSLAVHWSFRAAWSWMQESEQVEPGGRVVPGGGHGGGLAKALIGPTRSPANTKTAG